MSYVLLSEGGFQVVYTIVITPLACGPASPEVSKSCMDMASKLFTFTFKFTCSFRRPCLGQIVPWLRSAPRGRAGSHVVRMHAWMVTHSQHRCSTASLSV